MEWNPRVLCCRTRDLRSRDCAWRGLAASASAAVSPHSQAHRTPGLPALSPSRPPRMPHYLSSRRFPCRLRSSVAGVGLLGHKQIRFPLCLALHPEVRFAWSWVGYPRLKGCGMQSPVGPKDWAKVYPKVSGLVVGLGQAVEGLGQGSPTSAQARSPAPVASCGSFLKTMRKST
jgi:hypothetical protein